MADLTALDAEKETVKDLHRGVLFLSFFRSRCVRMCAFLGFCMYVSGCVCMCVHVCACVCFFIVNLCVRVSCLPDCGVFEQDLKNIIAMRD